MKSKKNFALFLSIFLNVMGIFMVLFILNKVGYFSDDETLSFNENPHYIERTNLFETVGQEELNSIVFIGDSITQRGLWDELFPNQPIRNRGINSDTSSGVLNRLDEIKKLNPSKVFLMIGVNDLYAREPIEEIVKNYTKILDFFSEELQGTEVFVQSVLPLNYNLYYAKDKIKNETINNLNIELKKLSGTFNYVYLDLNSLFKENGQLNPKLTTDGIHLNGGGYALWKNEINQIIE